MNKFLIIIMAITPLVYSKYFYQMYSLPKAYFFNILVGLLMIPLVLKTKIKNKHWWAWLYLGGILLSCFMSFDPVISWYGQYTRGLGVNGIILYVMCAILIMERFTYKDIAFMEWAFILCGILYASYAMFQYDIKGTYWVNSFAGNSNMAGFVFALIIPFALAKKNIVIITLLLAGLVLSACRGGMVATSLVFLFWFITGKKIRIFLIVLLIGGSIIGRFLPDDGPIKLHRRFLQIFHYDKTTRGYMIENTLPLLKNPLGTSLGNFRSIVAPLKSKEFEQLDAGSVWDNPHNIYLNSLAVFGWLPTFIWLLVLWVCLQSQIRSIRYVVFSYMVAGFPSFDSVDMLCIIWAVIGVGLLTSNSKLKKVLV